MKEHRKIKIAILGIRGIPACYGGFETFAEELCERLARQGFDVNVYCRKGSVPEDLKSYKGVRLIPLPTIGHKYLHSVFHTFLSTLHALFSDREILYYCGVINGFFCFLPRLFGKKTVVNVDGLEWKRKKWGRIGRAACRVAEWMATWAPTSVICDSREMTAYYLKRFGKTCRYISYGGDPVRCENTEALRSQFSLEPRKYFLYVSRLEPDNNALAFLKAYKAVKTEMPLVVVGDAPYAGSYIRESRAVADPRVRFMGYLFGEDCRLLMSHAYAYFHGNQVGGTNPGLLQAMAKGNCVLSIDTPFNREVLGDTGFFFREDDIGDLKNKIEQLLSRGQEVAKLRHAAALRASKGYNWETVALLYGDFFVKMCRAGGISPADGNP